MSSIVVTRVIDAPIGLVFNTVADINEFSKAIPDIVKVAILSDVKKGAGTRFRETRLMRGKERSYELEVTEYSENDRVRIVSESNGTVWDGVFTVRSEGGRVELTMAMEAKARNFVAKIMTFLIQGMIHKAVEQDMDSVKAFCENRSTN
jgi:hypothetical protein